MMILTVISLKLIINLFQLNGVWYVVYATPEILSQFDSAYMIMNLQGNVYDVSSNIVFKA